MFAQTITHDAIANATAECPECAGNVSFIGKTMKGEIVTCPDCGAELEVTAVNPIALNLAPKEEEDWGE